MNMNNILNSSEYKFTKRDKQILSEIGEFIDYNKINRKQLFTNKPQSIVHIFKFIENILFAFVLFISFIILCYTSIFPHNLFILCIIWGTIWTYYSLKEHWTEKI